MKKKGIILVIGIIILFAIILTQDRGQDPPTNSDELPIVTDEVPQKDYLKQPTDEWLIKVDADQTVTRAQVAKMLSLANFSKAKIQQFDREISFGDSSPDFWYDKYINVTFIHEWMVGFGEIFKPLELITNSQGKVLMEAYDVATSDLPFNINELNEKEPMLLKHWMEIYQCILKNVDLDNAIGTMDLIIVGTPSNVTDLNSWEVATDKGRYYFEGLALDKYIDSKIRVLHRDNEIISVIEVIDENPTLSNVWIVEGKENKLKIFVSGTFRTYDSQNRIASEIKEVIGDIVLVDKEVQRIIIKPDIVSGKILRVSNQEIELEGYGAILLTDEKKVYDISGEIKSRSLSHILVGYTSADFVMEDGKICAALIKEAVQIDKIRVVLSTTDFGGYMHTTARITSEDSYIVIQGDTQKEYQKGEILEVAPKDLSKDRMIIQPKNNNKIQILSIEKGSSSSRFNPSYRGKIEIAKVNDSIVLVNEVGFEEYLYAVVPSEMPSSYGLEASKVQAVTARSYAYNQFFANSYSSYGAHVDDSVLSQVYNNIPENEISIQAVKETDKKGLLYNQDVISAYFFSTSSGHTSSSGEVWAATKDFPSSTPAYLTGKLQTKELQELDLSDEAAFTKFIKDMNYETFDASFGWYRWNLTMSREELEASINKNLAARYEASPRLIKVLSEDNKFRSRPIKTIGILQDIRVYSRGTGGLVTEILIMGSEATIKVTTEYNIRMLLMPKKILENGKDIIINKKDGTKVSNFSLLPSAFFIMEKQLKDNALYQITFFGGGYGHGVGMSQNGVKAMVEANYTYEDVLKHYYSGIEIQEIY